MSVAGRKRKCYVNTGTYATPVWSEVGRVSNVKRGQSKGASDRYYRSAKNKKKVPGAPEYSFSFKYQIKNPKYADTIMDKFQDSFDNDTVLDMAFLNRAIQLATGTFTVGDKAKGIRGPLVCTKFDLDESDDEGVSYDVELVEVDEEQSGSAWEVSAYEVTITALP